MRVEASDWAIRDAVYAGVVEGDGAPGLDGLAWRTGQTRRDVQDALERLHAAHALFLDPSTRLPRIVNPFSVVPTTYTVTTGGKRYWANCALDTLGIPAALGKDAQIVVNEVDQDVAFQLSVKNGLLVDNREVVHFAIPFARWYDDLIDT